MVGIRRTDGGLGCPPTETPRGDYNNPFRVDSNGAIWVQDCFPGLVYFGEARHDRPDPVVPGSDDAKVTGWAGDNRVPIKGKYTTRTITNTTPCTLGILLGHNLICDMQSSMKNMVYVTLSERWNGEEHASASVSSQNNLAGTWFYRKILASGAQPHDVRAPQGGSSMQIPPGASATVSCHMYLQYGWGAPVPGELIQSANSAVRIYGYVLG